MMTSASTREEIVLWRCFFLIEFPPFNLRMEGHICKETLFLNGTTHGCPQVFPWIFHPGPMKHTKSRHVFQEPCAAAPSHLRARHLSAMPWRREGASGHSAHHAGTLPLSQPGRWGIVDSDSQVTVRDREMTSWPEKPARQCLHCGGSDLSAIWSQLEHLSGGRLLCALLPGMWLPSALLFCLTSGPQGHMRDIQNLMHAWTRHVWQLLVPAIPRT